MFTKEIQKKSILPYKQIMNLNIKLKIEKVLTQINVCVAKFHVSLYAISKLLEKWIIKPWIRIFQNITFLFEMIKLFHQFKSKSNKYIFNIHNLYDKSCMIFLKLIALNLYI